MPQNQEIFNFINSLNDLRILINYVHVPVIRENLFHKNLQQFWNELLMSWQTLQEKLQLRYWYHDLKPHPIIPSVYLIIGYYYYDQALIANNSEEKNFYFLKAAEYGCFNAILMLNNIDIDKIYAIIDNKLEAQEEAINIITRMDHRMTRLAKLHGTPGYIQLAKAYSHIANYWEYVNNKRSQRDAYETALSHMYTAQELYEYSSVTINNAYFGRDLEASNDLNLPDLPSMIQTFFESDENILNRAKRQAVISSQTLKHLFSGQASQLEIIRYLSDNSLPYCSEMQTISQEDQETLPVSPQL